MCKRFSWTFEHSWTPRCMPNFRNQNCLALKKWLWMKLLNQTRKYTTIIWNAYLKTLTNQVYSYKYLVNMAMNKQTPFYRPGHTSRYCLLQVATFLLKLERMKATGKGWSWLITSITIKPKLSSHTCSQECGKKKLQWRKAEIYVTCHQGCILLYTWLLPVLPGPQLSVQVSVLCQEVHAICGTLLYTVSCCINKINAYIIYILLGSNLTEKLSDDY